MLSKLGGEVDFEADGGCGWAQAILPLRLLLFYKVAYMYVHNDFVIKGYGRRVGEQHLLNTM